MNATTNTPDIKPARSEFVKTNIPNLNSGQINKANRASACFLRIAVSVYRRMRTTVTLDDDVFEAARAQAQASGKRLGEVLSQLARRGLRASAIGATRSGLPVFQVQRNAEIIPSTRAKELLAEDAT